ncbi:MAG TPA: hypothetical protein VL358_07170 [Caulobacteraceae bacterium]|nr:hypothetical protein [Caulobacteraceae bacterium]
MDFGTNPGRDSSTPSAHASFAYLEQDAPRFFYRWGGLLSSALTRVRARFHGDLDQYLIYLVFLLDDLGQELRSRSTGRHLAPRGLNALSVADVTEIPRETARRKLQMLLATGYLERREDGLYYLGARYSRNQFFFDLSPLFLDCVSEPASSQAVEPEPEFADC